MRAVLMCLWIIISAAVLGFGMDINNSAISLGAAASLVCAVILILSKYFDEEEKKS